MLERFIRQPCDSVDCAEFGGCVNIDAIRITQERSYAGGAEYNALGFFAANGCVMVWDHDNCSLNFFEDKSFNHIEYNSPAISRPHLIFVIGELEERIFDSLSAMNFPAHHRGFPDKQVYKELNHFLHSKTGQLCEEISEYLRDFSL
ncbi:hypothetical protein F4X86_03525 [Candidatus Saccharibacteria bacterium]|nr:hypothetical protein [Candidatus Saccharibacteria bacterium]